MKKTLEILPEPRGEGSVSCGSNVSVTAPRFNVSGSEYQGNAAIVTLGCAKNQVDSEIMLGVLQQSGFVVVNDLALADVIVVNTCGFLESSVKESIDCVLDVAELKRSARLRKLIVAGCMVERFKGDISESLPEADCFLTPDELLTVGEAATGKFSKALEKAGRPYFLYDDAMPRQLSTQSHTAYVKISEGCNRPCTFCVIPSIRGKMRSRSPASVYREVEALAAAGVREVNLVAQDLTAYGVDLRAPGVDVNLFGLLKELDRMAVMPWIRLLYAYPIGVDAALLEFIEKAPSICEYLDIPLQHSSERILTLMKRPIGRYSPRSVVELIKRTAPLVNIRTTFIVGFPGETDDDVEDLAQFIRESGFSSVGIFTYSKEEGTPSFDCDGHISEEEKEERRAYLMEVQQAVVAEKLQGLIGTVQSVLIDGPHEETELLIVGRTRFQAPEVDGQVMINDIGSSLPQRGDIVPVLITEVSGYDLVGRIAPSVVTSDSIQAV